MNENAPLLETTSSQPGKQLERAIAQVSRVLVGKENEICLAFTCLLAGGHLLIEDRPGVGKTTLAHALAVTSGLGFQRIQFTSDLLPTDIIGVSIYNRDESRFEFHPGPMFSAIVLADEVNRATPKAQSALLEAMGERQVTVDGQTHALPDPFFVVATQNPMDMAGTFPLPDSQLDRFLMRLSLGYPSAAAERQLLSGADRRAILEQLPACLSVQEINSLRARVNKIHVSGALLDYVQALIGYSRTSPRIATGLSPRAGLALLACARAWALVAGRDYCLPEDVQALLPNVAGHRLNSSERGAGEADKLIEEMLDSVAIP